MSWATHSHSPVQEGSPDIPLDGVMQDAAYLLRRICLPVHSQNRLSAKCYADRHETTDLRASAFGCGARGPGGRPALVRRLRPPSLPAPPCQLQGRERLCHSPLVGLRSPDGAHSHKALQRGGIEEALRKHSSRPERVHAAFDEGGTEALREMLHRSPREFGKDTSLWTLSLAAEVSFEEG
jgi:hypothetical protein